MTGEAGHEFTDAPHGVITHTDLASTDPRCDTKMVCRPRPLRCYRRPLASHEPLTPLRCGRPGPTRVRTSVCEGRLQPKVHALP